MRVIVAEDEVAMRKILVLYLEKQGFEVDFAKDGDEALTLIYEKKYDIAILDWMMPGRSGVEVCKEIKNRGLSPKVVLLTAKSEIRDEIQALNIGADDYVRKPFEPQVLLLRIKRLLNLQDTLNCGGLILNRNTQKVEINGREVVLSKKEFELLQIFMINQGIILSREKLLISVWGIDYEGDERTVDTHVKRLRAKLGEDFVKTRRGIGYCLEKII